MKKLAKKFYKVSFKILINVPAFQKQSVQNSFNQEGASPFGSIDSNLTAWLPKEFNNSSKAKVSLNILLAPLNNEELVETIGGRDEVVERHIFTPAQISYLVDKQASGESGFLLTNGFSNLFFILNHESNNLYLVGVVWDKEVNKWVPYIYRLRNLYRAWSRGNQIFVKK